LNVTVLSRPDSKSTFPASVKVVHTDYSKDDLVSKLKGQDAFLSFLGNAAFGAQTTIVDAAAEAGIKRFIPSEFGHNTDSEKVRGVIPIFESKRSVVEYIKKYPNLEYTSVSK
jgi:hypothetical protein